MYFHMGKAGTHAILLPTTLLVCCACAFALDPSLDISQYGHTAWLARDGFSQGNIASILQMPDGYLWFGTELGLFRFDGVRSVSWEPPGGLIPAGHSIHRLLVTRNGTLWIGSLAGVMSWDGAKSTYYPEFDDQVVESLLEDREGTVWVGGMAGATVGVPGLLCAYRKGSKRCYGEDGAFGRTIGALHEDSSGNLWAGTQTGLWRIQPGPPLHYPTPFEIIDLTNEGDAGFIMATRGAGLRQFADGAIKPYPVRGANDAGCLLRDRDGGLWIGTANHGLIHLHHGRTDVYSRPNGLSGNEIFSLFEDREGSVWVTTDGGLDRFREFPIITLSVEQGLSSDATESVMMAKDGAVWVGTQSGLNRLQSGQVTVFRKADGLPDDMVQSLFQDDRGRIWVFTHRGLAYFQNGRFIAVQGVEGGDVHSITGDKDGNLWLSEYRHLLHLRNGLLVEQIPWSELGRNQGAEIVLSGRETGGMWLGFWAFGGVLYFKDHQIRASYLTAQKRQDYDPVADLWLDRDGALWASTQYGGLHRIKDGHVDTLATRNGLPCNAIHWSAEDRDRSLWLYTGCGLLRITRTELDAWIADPNRRIQMTVMDAADGVRIHRNAVGPYSPRQAKSNDGKLWFVTGEGVQVVDPYHLVFNKLPPPVHIEKITADRKTLWQNWPGDAVSSPHGLPPLVRDLEIDYTALSFVAPEKVRFRVKLEGEDKDWRELVNVRHVEYTNLPPKHYRFRVLACNNSGMWNEVGDSLDFDIPPAWYQTNWFIAACVAAFLAMVWGIYQLRVRQLAAQFNMRLEERVSERTRIARDLHDTLLQSFQGLVLRFQAARNQLPERTEEACEVLDSALNASDQAIAEGRDAIQELRSGSSEESTLEQMLLATGRELAASQSGGDTAPPLRVIVEGQRRAKPMIREEIYRIAQELLRNAYRHAHARSIEAELRYDDDAFLLIVRDDGKGIDPKVLKDHGRTGHWGLPGMYERAVGMGARLDIWSEAGTGTEVRLTVPAAIAYEKFRDGGRFKLFRKRRIDEHRS
jgi:signal transduction histidine kinase/ligand-binding sensor domain-containing protein